MNGHRTKLAGAGVGAAAFLAAHAIEVAGWRAWFGPQHEVWFLNSGRAAAFTAACLFAVAFVAAIASRARRDEAIAYGGSPAAGAFVAMTAVLFATGPGTIFPIVLAFGAVFAIVTCVAGAVAGSTTRAALTRSHPREP